MTNPRLTETVAVCTACHHWQVDFPPRARDLGGPSELLRAAAELHSAHIHDGECVNPDGRIKIFGQWVERPTMASGRQATAVLAGMALPGWWTWHSVKGATWTG